MSVEQVERTWSTLCMDAGWKPHFCCSPNRRELSIYEARLDALIGDREAELLALVRNARKAATGFDRNYLDGIEGAIQRAVASPRVV